MDRRRNLVAIHRLDGDDAKMLVAWSVDDSDAMTQKRKLEIIPNRSEKSNLIIFDAESFGQRLEFLQVINIF